MMRLPRCNAFDAARCKKDFCPVHQMDKIKIRSKQLSQNYYGKAITPFIGRFGYPNVNAGIINNDVESSEEAKLYDDPKTWAADNYDIAKIVTLRTNIVNSRFKIDVRRVQSKFLDVTKEASQASLPADIEVNLDRAPEFDIKFFNVIQPMGPSARLKNIEITSNPKIDSRVDKVVSDIDFKASAALSQLYDKGFDENFLSRLLSVGNLGVKVQRKLVPTRWSITATDDTLGKHLIEEIQDFPEINYSLYYGHYLGNHYFILFFPCVWSYELFETHVNQYNKNNIDYMNDYEVVFKRKAYAENTVGGYYSVRLAVLEKLKEMKRKGSALVLRYIDENYNISLGVWVTREAARKMEKVAEFNDKNELLHFTSKFVKEKFTQYKFTLPNPDFFYSKSKLLNEIRTQRRLSAFF